MNENIILDLVLIFSGSASLVFFSEKAARFVVVRRVSSELPGARRPSEPGGTSRVIFLFRFVFMQRILCVFCFVL